MKKLHVLIAAVGLLIAGSVSAQVKIGYISIDEVVGYMPELSRDKVNMDTVGTKFVQDSVMPTINFKQDQYNQKYKEYSDTANKKLTPQIKKILENELIELTEFLQSADQIIQQEQQQKQQEFLIPYYKKAKTAIEQVAKERGYTHVLGSNVFLVAPEADNMLDMVLAKLKIQKPVQNPPGNKPAPKTGTGN